MAVVWQKMARPYARSAHSAQQQQQPPTAHHSQSELTASLSQPGSWNCFAGHEQWRRMTPISDLALSCSVSSRLFPPDFWALTPLLSMQKPLDCVQRLACPSLPSCPQTSNTDKVCNNSITNATLNGRNIIGGLVFDTNFATGKWEASAGTRLPSGRTERATGG